MRALRLANVAYTVVAALTVPQMLACIPGINSVMTALQAIPDSDRWFAPLLAAVWALWIAIWALPFLLTWHALGTNIAPGTTRIALWANLALTGAAALMATTVLAFGPEPSGPAVCLYAALNAISFGALAGLNALLLRKPVREELKIARVNELPRYFPVHSRRPQAVRSSVGDIEMFVTMLAAACSEPLVRNSLERLLSMPEEQRRGVVQSWVNDLLITDAPRDFIQAVACLLDPRVADKAYEVIYKRKRDAKN